VLARAFEAVGLPTTSIVLLKEHAQRTKPPRALFVPFPYGYALGKPNDPEFQRKVLIAALELFNAATGPVLAEFPENGDLPVRLIQASVVHNVNTEGDPADELTAMRRYYEQWVEQHSGRTAVGNCGVPARRFRGLVRYLQAYVAGAPSEYAEKPPEVSPVQFMRQAADDLKAFMLEARMQQRPNDRDNTLHVWFWGETAVGLLLARLAQKLKDEGEERAAFGIAR
jgi:hypothetical protein